MRSCGSFIEARLIQAVGARPAPRDEAAMRAGFASSMLIGIVVGRRIVGVPPLARADLDTLIALAALAIHAVLTSGSGSTNTLPNA